MDTPNISYKLGQVGGFPLRLSWFPRLVGFGNPVSSGDSEKTALEMGIGKNMVKSLRMWALATGMIDDKGDLTKRAKSLFSSRGGIDQYAEKEDTLWLLHWLVCSNLECFTANGWLLNFYHARSFTLSEAQESFHSHLVGCENPYALGTIRVDLETAVRMYAVNDDKNKRSDIDDRCFLAMRLFSASRAGGETRYVRLFREEQPRLSDKVISYAVIDAMEKRKTDNSSLSDLYAANSFPAPGMVFGLTRDGFLAALEKAADSLKVFSLTPMPDGDFQVRLKKGGSLVADDFYFLPRKPRAQ